MRITRLVAADRGDVLRAGGKADHQVHFQQTGTDLIVTLLFDAYFCR
jgi:hypothetical protein